MKHVKIIIVALLSAGTFFLGQYSGKAVAAQKSMIALHPEMDAALISLQDARKHLDLAARDFDGHRAKAVKLVDDAIAEVKAGIASDK